MKAGQKQARRPHGAAVERKRRSGDGAARQRRRGDGPPRPARQRADTGSRSPREPRGQRRSPQTAPVPRPVDRPARPKTASQAKARAKARKAKAPKAIRTPLRERLIARLATVDLSPRALLARIPFVVLVIGSLAVGLGITLWLSTVAAQRSYQLRSARTLNNALTEQKEALERDVLEAQSAPALADAARDLGMIPSRDTAHLVQDPAGNWVVIGQPKPAEGAPPPPLNFKLPDEKPPAPPAPVPPGSRPGSHPEIPTRLNAGAVPGSVEPGGAGANGGDGLVLVPVAPPAVAAPLAPVLAPLAPVLAPLAPMPAPLPSQAAPPPAAVEPAAPGLPLAPAPAEGPVEGMVTDLAQPAGPPAPEPPAPEPPAPEPPAPEPPALEALWTPDAVVPAGPVEEVQ